MGRSYSYEEFKKVLMDYIRGSFESDVSIEVHKVLKNNSLELDGMVIMKEESNISPDFYLNIYYEDYLKGKSIEEIADTIIEKHEEMQIENFEQFSMSIDSCIDKIVCRLVSYNKNRKLLEDTPHIQFLDMAIIFYCLVLEDENGIGSIRITNTLLNSWGLTTKILYKIAIDNTVKLFPKVLCPLKYMLRSIIFKNGGSEINVPDYTYQDNIVSGEDAPYILTNSKGVNGASVMLYPDCLKEIGDLTGNDLYILPSSIHEVLIVPDDGAINPKELESMVNEVNRNCVIHEEILSNNVYHFSLEKNIIEICI